MAEKIADLISASKSTILDFFSENGPVKLYFGDNFKNWILSKISESTNFPEPPKSERRILSKSMNDKEIIGEFKIQPYKSIPELLSVVHEKITKQPNGENGELLNNGYANIFYVQLEDRVVAVDVRWDSGDREWVLHADGLDDGAWLAGGCVFSRS